MQIPKWLTRKTDEYEFPPMPIATAYIPDIENAKVREFKMEEEAPQTNGIAPSPALSVSEQLRSAAAEAEKHEADRAKWAEAYAKVSEKIRDLSRENELLRLELVQKTNDLSTMQTRIYELQQENSDLAALQTEQHALAIHLVARYENHHIPLPIRSRVKRNGNKDKQLPAVVEAQNEELKNLSASHEK